MAFQHKPDKEAKRFINEILRESYRLVGKEELGWKHSESSRLVVSEFVTPTTQKRQPQWTITWEIDGEEIEVRVKRHRDRRRGTNLLYAFVGYENGEQNPKAIARWVKERADVLNARADAVADAYWDQYGPERMASKEMDMNIRSKLIRLAYENPEMRDDLLPLIQKEAAVGEHPLDRNAVISFSLVMNEEDVEEDAEDGVPLAMRIEENPKKERAKLESDALKNLSRMFGVKIRTHGHDSYGSLSCTFGVRSWEDVMKALKGVKRYWLGEGVEMNVMYMRADSFHLHPQGTKSRVFYDWNQHDGGAGELGSSGHLEEWLSSHDPKKKSANFDPEIIGAESDGALKNDADEDSYMGKNFSGQIFRELADRQDAGELADGQSILDQRAAEPGRKGINASVKTSRLHKRHEKVLEKYLKGLGSRASYIQDYDDLPEPIQNALHKIKWHESLWSDVNRWLNDNNGFYAKWAADTEWTGVVTVKAITKRKDLHPDDKSLPGKYGPYTVKARSKNDAEEFVLDDFHDEQGIEVLDDFDIKVKLKKLSSISRGSLIRMAYENPEMRADLLPLIKEANSSWSKLFPRNSYLNKFFKEKRIPFKVFEKTDKYGVTHMIENGVVVEMIAQTRGRELESIEDTIRKIDFKNGDVNHFFEHLAGAIANQYGSPF